MTASHRDLGAFLRRAGVFAAVLAIIAGLFGMHVMTGTHSMHSPAAVQAITSGDPTAAGAAAAVAAHPVHPPSGTFRAPPATATSDATGTAEQMCSRSESGNGLHAMNGSCLPSAKTSPLAAPPPGSTVFGIVAPAEATGTIRGDHSYHPGTPSPGELSISRT